MKKTIFVLQISFLALPLFARSAYCLNNALALAGSIVGGSVLTFITVLVFAKLLPKKNKITSCLTNIAILILWSFCCYFVCYLIRKFLY